MSNTPGPWCWVQEERAGGIYLATPDRGHLIVMDFVRQGMQTAQPRFALWKGEERERMGGIMNPAEMLNLEAHPDAHLIAAAPELLEACEAALNPDVEMAVAAVLIKAAIHKAKGGPA